MSAAQPPPLLRQQQLQQIQQMQQPLVPPDPGDGGGGRAGKTYEASGFFPPHQNPPPPLAARLQAESHSSSSSQQLQQHPLGPRPDFISQQQILYPHPQQQPLLVHPLSSAAPPPAGSAGPGGPARTTTGSSSSGCVPGRPAGGASATGNPSSSSSGCNQIQVEPRHVLQLLRQLVDGNPESFKRFQVRPDMPPRAVHQLLRELEEARLIKQQEVLRRAHALALQQQQQHRDGRFEPVSPPASACDPPSHGGAPTSSAGSAAGQETRHPQGGRHNREQQQGQQLAGDIGESERKKKKKKKAVFPEGPGGWGPETAISNNAAAAATAATTATAAPAGASLCNTSKITTGGPADVSGFFKVLPTLPHDRQVERLVELLAAPEGLAHVQMLKDTGRLPSALVQQALRKYRQQQKCGTSTSSSGSAGRPNEGAHPHQAGFDSDTVNARDGGSLGGDNDGSGIGASSSYHSAARLADPGSYGQKRTPFVKSSHQWTCKEDAWAATAGAAAADVGHMPAPAQGLLPVPPGAAADAPANQKGRPGAEEGPKAQANGDYVGQTAKCADHASQSGDMQKGHSSTVWLSDAVFDGGMVSATSNTSSGYQKSTYGDAPRVSASYIKSGPAENVLPSSDLASKAGADAASIFMKRELCSMSSVVPDGNLLSNFSEAARAAVPRDGEAPAPSRMLEKNFEASHNTTAATRDWLWQNRLQQTQQSLWATDLRLRRTVDEESEDRSLASLSDVRHFRGRPGASSFSSQGMIHRPVTVAAENEVYGEGNGVFRTTALDSLSFVSSPPLRATSKTVGTKDRAEHSTLALLNNSSIDGCAQGGAGGRVRAAVYDERVVKGGGRMPSDPASLLYFGKGVTPAHDRPAATLMRKNASSLPLSRLEMHIQRLVELTVRRLGAAYGGRLLVTDEAEIRAVLKQALKDRLRAIGPTLCALAEYRAERHLQRLVTGSADAEQRSLGEGFLFNEAEDIERSTMLYGSVSRQSARTSNLNDEASAFSESVEETLQEVETPRQLVCATRKRSYVDTRWQPSMTSHNEGAGIPALHDEEVDFFATGVEAGAEGLRQRREKCCRKSLLERFAVHQRFDELHVLFMQKESDKLLVEHLRKLQEQQRKGKGGGRGKHKHLLATDSSLQSAPFIRNADEGREGYDSAMGGYKSAGAARGAARDAAVRAVLAYLEKQALLLNSSSINSDADAQLALLSAQLDLELRQQQLSEVAEEKAIEFAKVAHAQRLLLLKATALDFRMFLHTRTAAAFFPMRFRERLLHYVEAVHFDLQRPPPRIPRILLPVASPPQSAAETAAGTSTVSAGAAAKATAGHAGKFALEKRVTTTAIAGSSSVHLARSVGLSTTVSSASGKSNTTLVSAFAACGLLRSSASAVSDGTKSSGVRTAAKEARGALPTSVPSQTLAEGQDSAIHVAEKTIMDGNTLDRNGFVAAGETGVHASTKDGASTVRTARKRGTMKTPKARVRRKVSGAIVSLSQTDMLRRSGQREDQARAQVLDGAETPEALSGVAGTGEKGGSREQACGGGKQNSYPPGHRRSSSVSNIEEYKHSTSDAGARSVHLASASAMAESQTVLRRQLETRTASPPSRAESLAELFGIPTVDSTEMTTSASRIPGVNAGVKSNSNSNVSNSSRHREGNVRKTSQNSSGSRRGTLVSKTKEGFQAHQLAQHEPAGTRYADLGSSQWGSQAGHSGAGEINRKQPHPAQQTSEHRRNSGHVVMSQDENISTAGGARHTEQPGGFSFTHVFNTVPGTECSSAGVVIPELEGEGEEDCL